MNKFEDDRIRLSKKAVLWGTHLLVAVLVPFIMHGVPDLLKGFTEGTN